MKSQSTHKIELTLDERGEHGRIARIVVDNQRRLNTVNSELIQRLTEAIHTITADDGLRLLILTGAGDRAFIGGADINELAALDRSSAREFISRLHEACLALRELPVPVIARIDGYCLGAGVVPCAAPGEKE